MSRDRSVQRAKAVMSTPEGRAWVWALLSSCGVFRTSFTPNALEISFNEGQRNVGLKVLDSVQDLTPREYQFMVAEAQIKNDEVENDVAETD